jgi:hypothetical protein
VFPFAECAAALEGQEQCARRLPKRHLLFAPHRTIAHVERPFKAQLVAARPNQRFRSRFRPLRREAENNKAHQQIGAVTEKARRSPWIRLRNAAWASRRPLSTATCPGGCSALEMAED